ncbi:MAG: DNA repair protein RecO [Prevotella sp.]|nr:DNA repair protein RecO [Prevotella sp.]
MLTKTRAIVLHSIRYGERQMIVDMLTSELGRMSFLCRMPSTQKGKLKKQFFQPLTQLELEVDYHQKSNLQRLRDVRMAMPWATLPFNAEKLAVALFLAEFLLYATRDEQQNEPLFEYVSSSIEWLDTQSGSVANFHLVFMMRLSRFIGFFPNLEDYREGAYFDLRNGSFSNTVPLHPDFLGAEDSARIGVLMRMTYKTMHLFHLTREERQRCVETILTYYRLHVPNFPELKSLGVLQELYGTHK